MAHIDERTDACRVLVGKPEGRRPLGRHVHRWNIVYIYGIYSIEYA
jgi:hypothetical protein